MSNHQQNQGLAPTFAAPAAGMTNLASLNADAMLTGFQHNSSVVPHVYFSPYTGGNPVQHFQRGQSMPQYAQIPPMGNTTPSLTFPTSTTSTVHDNMQAAAYSIPSNWNRLPSGVAAVSVRGGAGDNVNAIHPTVATSSFLCVDTVPAVDPDGVARLAWQSHCQGDSDSSKSSAPTDKVRQNRDRNREHARSTRLRKKAYVQKLKEMADGLRAVQTEEIRQRRLAVHAMTTTQKTRKRIVHQFLKYHADFEADPEAWGTIIEESFWLKQPVTPFRSFRRSEVEMVSVLVVISVKDDVCDSLADSVSFLGLPHCTRYRCDGL
jgi:hypothetical protein